MSAAPTTTPRYIVLQGATTSLILQHADEGAPVWRYWGPRIDTAPSFAWEDAVVAPPASLNQPVPFTIAPCFGSGWFGESALLAHRAGHDFAQAWTRCEIAQSSETHAKITLTHVVTEIQVVVTLQFDAASDVLRMQSTLTNSGAAILDVQWLAAGTLPLPALARYVHSTRGAWANELAPQVDPLTTSGWSKQSRRGRAGHDAFPAAIVACEGVTQHAGLVFGATLAWSGNHAASISALDDGRYQWQMGEWLAPGEVRLAPDESLTTPTLLAACSTQGLDGLAHQFHAAVRRQLTWPSTQMSPRPVHINTWEAVYFDHDEASLMALASDAAALGVERFVLDDGWFHGRDHDRAGLGDWTPDVRKYPQGLGPLIAHVQACGMQFGLWVEPEMCNPDSDLYREHATWALQLQGRPLQTARQQLVLDVSNPAVSAHLFDSLARLLKAHPISYLKWDMNRDLSMAGDANGRAAYRRQVHALYALLQRVRESFPQVEIESCASGGARMDFGILNYTHRVWPSDANDALTRLLLQRAALQWLPPELLGSHVGAAPSHTSGRSQSIAFRAAVALPCHFGLELDPRVLTPADRAVLAQWIALYRRLRGSLHNARVWRGDCGDGVVWQAHGDEKAAIVFVYRLNPTTQRMPPSLTLPFVRPDARYRLTRIDPAASSDNRAIEFHGDWLANAGWPLPRMQAESAMVLQLSALKGGTT
jgi:alpha-galactosidase